MFGTRLDRRRFGRITWRAEFGGRRRSRSEEQAGRRRRGRRDGRAEEGGHHLQGLVPVPRREDAVVHGHPARETLALLRLRAGRRHLQLRDAARRRRRSRRRSARLAGKAGVEIDERTKREDAHKARLRDVLDSAIAFYHAVLTGSKTGEPPSTTSTAAASPTRRSRRYQLGWAPGGWDTMTRKLAAKRDIRPEELVEVGLASPRQSARGGVYDKFRRASSSRSATRTAAPSGWAAGSCEGDGPEVPQLARRRRCSTRAARCT